MCINSSTYTWSNGTRGQLVDIAVIPLWPYERTGGAYMGPSKFVERGEVKRKANTQSHRCHRKLDKIPFRKSFPYHQTYLSRNIYTDKEKREKVSADFDEKSEADSVFVGDDQGHVWMFQIDPTDLTARPAKIDEEKTFNLAHLTPSQVKILYKLYSKN